VTSSDELATALGPSSDHDERAALRGTIRPRLGRRAGFPSKASYKAYSALARVTAGTLALSPIRECISEGFVTSTAAPAASGWSRCRVGLALTGKRGLVTARANSRH
jgi:hypothetical protein